MLLCQALDSAVVQASYTVEELTRPPAPAEPACLSYCPRCDQQYTVERGTCPHCGVVKLCGFSAVGTGPSVSSS